MGKTYRNNREETAAYQSKAGKSNKGEKIMKNQDAWDQLRSAVQESEKSIVAPVIEEAIIVPPVTEEVKVNPPSNGKVTHKVILKNVPVVTEMAKGLRIRHAIKGGQPFALIQEAEFPVSIGNVWYKAYLEGKVRPVICEIADHEIRKQVLVSAIDEFRNGCVKQYGKPKMLITNHADSSHAIFYLGFREDIVSILKCDPTYKRPVSKATLPTFSNQILALEKSSIDILEFRVVDPKLHHGGVNTNDGAMYLDNIKFSYWEYVSKKDSDAGKKPKLIQLKEAQARVIGPVVKGLCTLNTFMGRAEEFCAANGLELGECYGAIDVDSIKANVDGDKVRYHHGDVMGVNINELKFINMSSKDGVSNCGVQLRCTDIAASTALLEEVRPTHKEPGIYEKALLFKRACAFEAEAFAEVIKSTYSISDSYLKEIKATLFAIPKNAKGEVVPDAPGATYYSPAWESVYNQNCANLLAYYFNHLIKVRTSNTNHYYVAHPSVLLDKLEREYFDKTGVWVNFCIASDDKKFIEQLDEFNYFNLGRAPFVSGASIQEALCLRKDENGQFILDPDRLRKGEGKLYTGGNDVQVSWALLSLCFNGDVDGDIDIEVFSNKAQFPMWRPANMPDIFHMVKLEDDPKIAYLTDDEWLEAQKLDYCTQIQSQLAIGQMDNYTKLLYITRVLTTGQKIMINGTERIGKPIPIEIGDLIGKRREETIQAKKHVLTADHIKDVIADFTRWYAPGGKLPKGDAKPAAYLLLHNALGLFDDGTDETEPINSGLLMKRLIRLVHRINHEEGVHELDCYRSLWRGLEGLSCKKENTDSQYWRNKLYNLWEQRNSLFDHSISATTAAKIVWFAGYLTGTGLQNGSELSDDYALRFSAECDHELKFSGYRYWSAVFMDIADEDTKTLKYAALFKRVEVAINKWLDDMAKEGSSTIDPNKREVYHKLLAIQLGVISFGTGVRQEDKKSYALPGYAFWCINKNVLAWVGEQVHPNNPMFTKYAK